MTLVQPFAVFADVMTSSNAFVVNPDYLIGSSSNADPYGIATMDLTDVDYGIAPASSLGSIINSILSDRISVTLTYSDGNNTYYGTAWAELIDGSYELDWSVIDNFSITGIYVNLYSRDLPSPGPYSFSYDYSSDMSYSYSSFNIYTEKNNKNASPQGKVLYPSFDAFSGELYVSPYDIELTNLYLFQIRSYIPYDESVRELHGSFKIKFTRIASGDYESTAGSNTSNEDYQADVSGSLSNISSSIGDMSGSLDSAAENLEYISTSQNLIIQGIDNVIMHISDQLYAFWDQLYNLIHEPTYARLGDILDAIRNLDLEITVEMTEVTNSINKMNQDMQIKLQNVQQTITQGFDNSVMESEASKLDDSISEYDEAEQSVIQNVNDSLNDFEFDAELGEYQSIVSVVSDFLQQLYESSGGFKVLINLSMLLSLAGIVIGIYRFGGGS